MQTPLSLNNNCKWNQKNQLLLLFRLNLVDGEQKVNQIALSKHRVSTKNKVASLKINKVIECRVLIYNSIAIL